LVVGGWWLVVGAWNKAMHCLPPEHETRNPEP